MHNKQGSLLVRKSRAFCAETETNRMLLSERLRRVWGRCCRKSVDAGGRWVSAGWTGSALTAHRGAERSARNVWLAAVGWRAERRDCSDSAFRCSGAVDAGLPVTDGGSARVKKRLRRGHLGRRRRSRRSPAPASTTVAGRRATSASKFFRTKAQAAARLRNMRGVRGSAASSNRTVRTEQRPSVRRAPHRGTVPAPRTAGHAGHDRSRGGWH